MNRYPIAKLVQWAGPGGISGRKRLQKVVFFLQKAGCPFEADYLLHHYGPYSWDVAGACDELISTGILEEKAEMNSVGTQYTYRMSASGATALTQTEQRLGVARATKIAEFKSLAVDLIHRGLWELELGSTILFFRNPENDWNDAVRRACDFKKIDAQHDSSVPAAKALAERVYAMSGATR